MASSSDEDQKAQSIAVALKYEHGDRAVPQVVAIGRGHIAEAIIQRANATGVPIEQDEVLAKSLASLKLDQSIPPELYKAVAAVIGFLIKKSYIR